jgi:hypothetical protein
MTTIPTFIEDEKNWLEKTIVAFLSYKEDSEQSASMPEEMIDEAAERAFKVSTALGLIPGPLGMAVILPEVIAITRLQVNLICRIARHFRKHEPVNMEIVLLILGNVMGITAGEALARKVGTRLVIRSANSRIANAVARKIGKKVVEEAAEKAIGRWIPLLTAPLFGYFSRSLTKRIGREAVRLLSLEFEREGAPSSLP